MAAASQFKREWIPRTKNKSATKICIFPNILFDMILKILHNQVYSVTLKMVYHTEAVVHMCKSSSCS